MGRCTTLWGRCRSRAIGCWREEGTRQRCAIPCSFFGDKIPAMRLSLPPSPPPRFCFVRAALPRSLTLLFPSFLSTNSTHTNQNQNHHSQCVENLESILRSDKAVVYWLRSGCMHLDREGPEIVKPCPAHAICAWVPNLFADVGIISPRNSLAPLCPRDFKYLPRIPRKPATATAL
jgi:hypothetical protein